MCTWCVPKAMLALLVLGRGRRDLCPRASDAPLEIVGGQGSRIVSVRQRRCEGAALGLDGHQNGRAWPAGEVLLASIGAAEGTRYVVAIPQVVLRGEGLTSFLDRVAPFGCPVPGSLIRAYSL